MTTKGAQIVGNGDTPCRRVAILVGASAGRSQIDLLARPDIDAVIAGDINEWEGCEYVRDAVSAKMNKGFIVLGHGRGSISLRRNTRPDLRRTTLELLPRLCRKVPFHGRQAVAIGVGLVRRDSIGLHRQCIETPAVDAADTHLFPVEIQKSLGVGLHLERVSGTLHVVLGEVPRRHAERRGAHGKKTHAL